MSILGFALVLSAAVCHATWNFFVKRLNAGAELVWLFSVAAAVIYFPLTLYVLSGIDAFDRTQILFLVGSALIHLGYFLLLQTGYRHGALSLVYPTARSTGPLLASCFAVLFLGEVVTVQTVLGGVTIIFGVLMLTGGFGRGGDKALVSVGFGVGAGLLIGSYTAWDAYAVSVLLVPPLLLDYASSIARIVLLAPVALRRRQVVARLWSAHRIEVLAIAVFSPLAYILVLVALTFTPVIYVAPLREVSVLLTVLMGSLLLGEGHLRTRLFWSCIILCGVVALALG
ncbi:DMT family transporter [Ruegeria sp. 2205SS24-7]|uniref:DMT family transporter n=1 Tax=Ruegeria discodermiae TaxID=3064389 RepID=UPI002741D1D5|nr:DMT family transporter [Ruegeria sp. 2205SS24-7]MDP5215740.1 DMT family transporter [Ruegeria sp. 2205SS24-7]